MHRIMVVKILLPPSRCQRCIAGDPCADCENAPDHVRDAEARKGRVDRLLRFYLSGDAAREWNRIRADLDLGPIPGTEDDGHGR